MKKRILSIVLAVVMIAGMIPLGTMTAFAFDAEDLGEITAQYMMDEIEFRFSNLMHCMVEEGSLYCGEQRMDCMVRDMMEGLTVRLMMGQFTTGDYELRIPEMECELRSGGSFTLTNFVLPFSFDADTETVEIGGGTPKPKFTSYTNGVMTFTVPKCTKVEKTGNITVSCNGGTGVTADASFCTITGNTLSFAVKNGDSAITGISDKVGKYTITIPKVTYTTDKGDTVDAENVEFTYYISYDYSFGQVPLFRGSGTDAAPYLVDAWYLLDYLADAVNAGNSAFKAASYMLTANISGMTKCIGTESNPFTGHFDGNGFKVTLNINQNSDCAGLFGYLDRGVIKNVTTAGSVTGNNNVGGVCGNNYAGKIINCYNTANVYSDGEAGGICGRCKGTLAVNNCCNTGNVNGGEAGGIVGYINMQATVVNCYSAGTVIGVYKGGICGLCVAYSSCTIANCYYDSTLFTGDLYGSVMMGSVVCNSCYGLPAEQMKAESKTTLNTGIAGNKPLVDLLNEYTDANPYDGSHKLMNWTNEQGEYPVPDYPIKVIDVPTAVTGLIYTGEEQTGVEEGKGYTLTGNTATDAGEYTATATLASGYIWADGTLTPKEIEWEIASAHTHSLTEVKTKDATCTEPGVKIAYWVCSGEGGCGKCFTSATDGTEISKETLEADYIEDAKGHNFSGDAVSNNNGTHSFKCVNSDCTAVGTMDNTMPVEYEESVKGYVTCSGGTATCTAKAACSTCTAEYGDVLGHDFKEQIIDNDHLVSAATCTAKAVYYYDCSRCDVKSSEDTFEYGNMLDHSYTGAYKDNGNGTHSRKCVNGCNAYGNPTAHTGMGDFICDDCGYIDTAAQLAAAKVAAIAEIKALVTEDASEEIKAVADKATKDILAAGSITSVNEIKTKAINDINALLNTDVCEYCGKEHESWLDLLECLIVRVINFFLGIFVKNGILVVR